MARAYFFLAFRTNLSRAEITKEKTGKERLVGVFSLFENFEFRGHSISIEIWCIVGAYEFFL